MISVCIATYNGELYIKEQLDSILNQISETDEIIISDDSSTDRTIEIIESFNDPRIKLLLGNTFHNPIYNFENALKHASGEWIFLSDQDDLWMDTKVATLSLLLKSNDLVLSDCCIINAEGSVISPSFFKYHRSRQGLIHNLFKNSYIGCCMAFNRSILTHALPFPPDIPMHDWWIGLVAEIYAKPFFCTDSLVAYRRHGSNLSDSAQTSRYSLFQKIRFRLNLIKNLLTRYFFHA